jgi:hypothetical protein
VVSLDGSPPREVLPKLIEGHKLAGASAAWHPDGNRISIWLWDTAGPTPDFWTGPVEGGAAVRSEIAPEVARQLREAAAGDEWAGDFKFSWAPSGRAIYFERTFRAARNVWRMTVDPQTLRATGIERVTTGPGLDTEFLCLRMGKRWPLPANPGACRPGCILSTPRGGDSPGQAEV